MMFVRIGQYLKRLDWRDPHVASDRIRGEWVMRCCPEMEVWRPGVRYDVSIFHNPVPHVAEGAGIKILDVCDPMWGDVDHFRRLAGHVDGIVTATDELRRQVLEIADRPVRTIGDGHWLPFYETRRPNPHVERAKTVVWFGYADNAHSIVPLLPVIEAAGLVLVAIAERQPVQHAVAKFVPWELDGYIREISRADFAVLPMTRPYKSNNKDVSAMLAGIPVAKTADDIRRLVDPVERRREMERLPEVRAAHDVACRAREYMQFIDELDNHRRTRS